MTEQGQQAPPGFHVISLPFADDIRLPPLTALKGGKELLSINFEHQLTPGPALAAEEQTDAACKIIEKLTLKGQGYVPDTYLNPGQSTLLLTAGLHSRVLTQFFFP